MHGRPAAFEGSDGFSYSVEILSDSDQHPREPWGAYFFFVKHVLDELIAAAPGGEPKRKWWDAMNADDDSHGHSHS